MAQELKARGVDDVYIEYYETGKHELAQVYLKYEADNVITELKEKLKAQTSIAEEGWKASGTYHTSYAEAVKELYDKNKEIAELKEERRWRKCSEELPTENDANESGKLLGYLGGYKIAHEYHWTDVRDKLYGITHWMPLPKAPEDA